MRYAENPPKEIPGHRQRRFLLAAGALPALWIALRDIVLFWVSEGVRIFRVDNPHTKPSAVLGMDYCASARPPSRCHFSFGGLHPAENDVPARQSRLFAILYIFHLAEHQAGAHRLFRRTDDVGCKGIFRPHLFVNTPDINPYFLQTSGRPGFLIRAALAATLSGLWGMYSGFELCEAAPLPGREEYLNSEKYEIRVRRYDAPGNIVAEIAQAQSHSQKHIRRCKATWGLRFYPAHNDQVILYGKPLPAERRHDSGRRQS